MILDRDFHRRYGPWAVVAGASEGIGRAYANALAEQGLSLLMIARRSELLEEEARILRRRHRVEVVTASMDLAAPDLAERFTKLIDGKDVGMLVYNACYSKIAPYMESDLASKMATIDVNCRGPVILTSILGERFVARGRGGIVLMSSMAGNQGSAMVATYAASKAFDTVLGEGLWAELGPKGVDVLVCVAGATSTPNFLAQTPESKRAQVFPMSPEDVARGGLANLRNGPVYYAGPINRTVATATRLLSRRAAVSFMSKNTRKVYE